jgi:hypothetical protein
VKCDCRRDYMKINYIDTWVDRAVQYCSWPWGSNKRCCRKDMPWPEGLWWIAAPQWIASACSMLQGQYTSVRLHSSKSSHGCLYRNKSAWVRCGLFW